MAVSKRTRYEVLRRDNHTCRYCGGAAPDVKLHIDHVLPVSLGGSDDPDNLVTACEDCNVGKGSSAPSAELVADVQASDLRWADAIKRAGAVRAAEQEKEARYFLEFLDAWPQYRYRLLPSDVEEKVARLYRAGLPVADMILAARAATSNPGVYNRFGYFMGICWNKITELQEIAKALLAAEAADD